MSDKKFTLILPFICHYLLFFDGRSDELFGRWKPILSFIFVAKLSSVQYLRYKGCTAGFFALKALQGILIRLSLAEPLAFNIDYFDERFCLILLVELSSELEQLDDSDANSRLFRVSVKKLGIVMLLLSKRDFLLFLPYFIGDSSQYCWALMIAWTLSEIDLSPSDALIIFS